MIDEILTMISAYKTDYINKTVSFELLSDVVRDAVATGRVLTAINFISLEQANRFLQSLIGIVGLELCNIIFKDVVKDDE